MVVIYVFLLEEAMYS